jgi:hypothetical protein
VWPTFLECERLATAEVKCWRNDVPAPQSVLIPNSGSAEPNLISD